MVMRIVSSVHNAAVERVKAKRLESWGPGAGVPSRKPPRTAAV